MGRGRKPKPTHLKLLQGNPGKRPVNKREPKPRPIAPSCPSWLSAEAKKEWAVIAPELERLGLLTIIDGSALAGYCQSYARWKQAERVLDKDGFTRETESGFLQQRPEVSIAQKSLGLVAKFLVEFGMTPSSRARLTLPEAGDEDAFFGPEKAEASG